MIHGYNDTNKNKVEVLSKEEVYALLAEAIQEGQLPVVPQATAFVTMIKSIVDGRAYKIGFCTQATYNELVAQGELETNALYVITDDDTYDELEATITQLEENVEQNGHELQNARKKSDTYQYFSQAGLLFYQGATSNVILALKSGKTVADTIGISGSLTVELANSTEYEAYFDSHWNVAESQEAKLNIIVNGSVLTVDLVLESTGVSTILHLASAPVLKTFSGTTVYIESITTNGIKLYYK